MGVVVALASSPSGTRAQSPPEAPPSARRVSPADHDAVRPVFSPDGKRLAYVRLPAPEPEPAPAGRAPAPEAAGTLHVIGEEIWESDPATGEVRRWVSSEDLVRAGLVAARYDLLDLAWSPAGDRLAFTWFDGEGWGQIAFADPDGRVVPLPAPVMSDPWEDGALFDMTASQFLWGRDGRSGTFVAWDEDCGSLYRVRAPAPGSWPGLPVAPAGSDANSESAQPGSAAAESPATPQPIEGESACRSFLAGAPGFWLYTEFDEEFAQRLVVITDSGEKIENVVFPQGRPPRVRWGESRDDGRPHPEASPARPPILGWWYDTERRERLLFTWQPGSMIEWRREACPTDGADPAAMTPSGILFLDGPPAAARLVAIARPAGPLREILPAPVEDVVASAAGSHAVAVRGPAGGHSLWLVDPRSSDGPAP